MNQMQKAWILNSRPQSVPTNKEVSFESIQIPEPQQDQVLIKNLYMSVDPAMRGWMSDAPNYLPPIDLGSPCWAIVLGRVVKSHSPLFQEGDLVTGFGQWAEFSISFALSCTKLPEDSESNLTNYLSVLGTTGLTAYFGMLACGKPKKNETVLVSAAAGAVGSIAGQIAKIQGCRVVGLAGGEEKCNRIVDEFGFDTAIDYKQLSNIDEIQSAIANACPNGVDVYFDNVGGDILDAVLMEINQGARISMCGAIASYSDNEANPGPKNYWQLLVKNAVVEGFTVFRFSEQYPKARLELAKWLAEGKLSHREEIIDGLDNALSAFAKLFDGSNQGKLIVKVSED